MIQKAFIYSFTVSGCKYRAEVLNESVGIVWTKCKLGLLLFRPSLKEQITEREVCNQLDRINLCITLAAVTVRTVSVNVAVKLDLRDLGLQ